MAESNRLRPALTFTVEEIGGGKFAILRDGKVVEGQPKLIFADRVEAVRICNIFRLHEGMGAIN